MNEPAGVTQDQLYATSHAFVFNQSWGRIFMRLGGWLQSIPLYIPRRNKLRAILRAQDRSEGAKDEQEVSRFTGV